MNNYDFMHMAHRIGDILASEGEISREDLRECVKMRNQMDAYAIAEQQQAIVVIASAAITEMAFELSNRAV